MPSSDWKVEIVDASGDADYSVTVVGDQVVDLTGASAGDVLTVQPDGTVAPDPAGTPGTHAATHADGGADEVALNQKQITTTVGAALGTTGTVNLDMAALNGAFQTIALTGDITFTTSNLAAGRSVSLFISAAALRTFTFPAWLFVGAVAPASIAAGKAGVLTLTSTAAADGGVYAAWAATP